MVFVALGFTGPASLSPGIGGGNLKFSSGNIGIGITPEYTFDVSGGFRVGNATSTAGLVFDPGTGNVGIGTVSPASKLTINGIIEATGALKFPINSSSPFTCDASTSKSLAMTAGYTTCACNGTGWVKTSDGATSCVWGASSPPTSLVLTQTVRRRDFTVSWTAGTGNGGVGGCRLQYYTGSVWTDLSYATYNCDANTTNAAAQLNGDNFTATTWNATGLQIRLQRISDSASVAAFSQNATCSAVGGSGSATPLIDEDCNRYWDNYTTGTGYNFLGQCANGASTATPGASYSCTPPTPSSCQSGADTVSFWMVSWNGVTNGFNCYMSDATCTNLTYACSSPGVSLYAQNGTVPTSDANGWPFDGSCYPYGGGSRKATNTSSPLNAGLCTWSAYSSYTTYTYY